MSSPTFDTKHKRNFVLILEYDGGGYHGWQRQLGVMTVQEMVESKLAIMLGEPVAVQASGRTDAGVHAKGQVAGFRARTRLQPADLQKGLNSLLPSDIVVIQVDEAPHSFHARFSAVSKIYEYRILNRFAPSALRRNYCWHIRQPLDSERMREALQILIGKHDFAAFMASGSSVRSTIRILYQARLQRQAGDQLIFQFEADGFLRHMVRNMVGTLVDIGRGKLSKPELKSILESLDRRNAGMTAPAHGLYLLRVLYDTPNSQPTNGG